MKETRNEMTERWIKETTKMNERHSAERKAQNERWDKEKAALDKPVTYSNWDYAKHRSL